MESYCRDESEAALKGASDLLRSRGLAFTTTMRVGHVDKEINQHVQDNAIDMVVVGSHGHAAHASMAIGSVTAKLIATNKVPLAIVR